MTAPHAPALPRDFAGQFVLAKAPPEVPEAPGAPHRESLASLHLALWPGLRFIRVVDAAGQAVGALLGDPVDYRAGSVPQGTLRLSRPLGADIDRFVETEIYALSGSFIFILDCAAGRRVYLDADGSLSAVFDPETGRVAATAPLLLGPDEYAARFDRELYDFLHVRRDGWFPAGLTAHRGIERILCNHYLDLDRGSQHRHWPAAQIAITDDPGATCDHITKSTRATIDALRRAGSVWLTLTAGNETRLILAACRDIAGELDFVTVDGTETRLDAIRAGELAARFGLRHRFLPLIRADAVGEADWHARAGQCIGGPNMTSHPTILALRGRDYFIGGLGGEIGRGFFWRPADTAQTPVTTETILSRLGMPVHPRVREAVAGWLPSVAAFDPFLQLDLAYLELRMGCWAFAQAYSSPEVRHMHPMISRQSFSAMLSLPPDWRRSGRMIEHAIRRCWPELLELPINRYGDYRDTLRLVRRAAAQPHLIVKSLRKRFG